MLDAVPSWTDSEIRRDERGRYESIARANGWVKLPSVFTPGPQVRALL